MSEQLTVKEVAAKTAAELRRRGRITGAWWDEDEWCEPEHEGEAVQDFKKDCKVCLVGAVAAATTGDPESADDWYDGENPFPDFFERLQDETGIGDKTPLASAIHFNDAICSSDQDDERVLAVLDKLAGAA